MGDSDAGPSRATGPDLPLSASTGSPEQPRRRSAIRRAASKHGALLLMMTPGLLLLLVFNYTPMVGLVIAFKNYRAYQGLWGSAWVGLQNFQYLFGTSDAWHITYNTLLMNGLFIVTVLVGSIIIALLLNEIRDGGVWLPKFYQSTLFVPYVLSYVLISYFVFALLSADSGVIDKLLTGMGLPSVDWYSSAEPWRVILTLVNLWKNAGFWSIVYLAGMLAISPEYYEAARIDGASKWVQIRLITLPLLMPLIIINLLLSIGRIFYADFGLFYQVPQNSGLLYSTTDVIDTYVFRSLTVTGNVGMAAAAGFYQAVVGFTLVVISNWVVRRIDPDRALF
jgi:putative aldouronate transport system permease protein